MSWNGAVRLRSMPENWTATKNSAGIHWNNICGSIWGCKARVTIFDANRLCTTKNAVTFFLIWKCKRVELSWRFMTLERFGKFRESWLNTKIEIGVLKSRNDDSAPWSGNSLQRVPHRRALLQRVLILKEAPNANSCNLGCKPLKDAFRRFLILTLNIKIIFKTFIIRRTLFSEFWFTNLSRVYHSNLFQDGNLVEQCSQTRSISSNSFDPISIFEDRRRAVGELWMRRIWMPAEVAISAAQSRRQSNANRLLVQEPHFVQRPSRNFARHIETLRSIQCSLSSSPSISNLLLPSIGSTAVELHQNNIQNISNLNSNFWMQTFKFEPNLMVKHRRTILGLQLCETAWQCTWWFAIGEHTVHWTVSFGGSAFMKIGSAKITRYNRS